MLKLECAWQLLEGVTSLFFWLTAAIVFILDQGSKYLVKKFMSLYETIPLIPGIFHLTYIENPGAAFGILAHQRYFFIIVTLLILVFVYFFNKKIGDNQILFKTALGMFQIWPVFNIADIAVVISMAYIAYWVLTSGEGF